MKKWAKVVSIVICMCSCNKEKRSNSVHMKSCSALVSMSYTEFFDGQQEIFTGPRAHIWIEICNETKNKLVFTPNFGALSFKQNENPQFALVIAHDTLPLSGVGSVRVPEGKCTLRPYELVLWFDQVKEADRDDFISDSTYYKNKMVRLLEQGEVIFRDSTRVIHATKSPDFKIDVDWEAFPDSLFRSLKGKI